MAPAPPSTTSEGLMDRLQDFVTENKRAVLIGAGVAAVAVGSVGYYMYTNADRPDSGAPGGSKPSGTGKAARKEPTGDDSDTGTSKSKKRSSKKKTVRDPDGPLLEERKPKQSSEKSATVTEVPESPRLTPADIATLSHSERTARAQAYKARGNQAYQHKKFSQAIDLYTRAIEVASAPEAVYFSNRAACYMNLQPAEYEKAVTDCDEALKRDPTYIKALNRRGTALDALKRDEEALRDFTAVTILENFQNESTAQMLERTLKKLAQVKTENLFSSREMRLPSHTFISAYLAAFRPRPTPTLPQDAQTGDHTLILAYDALAAGDYPHAFPLINEALEQGVSWDEGKAKALNLRGTFKFLLGDTTGARDDLQASIDLLPTFTQTWVKIASVWMEMGHTAQAFEAFEEAISYDEKDPDIYYHRGQVHFIMGNFDAASDDYSHSTALDNSFVFSQIQYAVAQYKKGETDTAKATFRKTMQQFPDRSEVLNYYGELLMDLQLYQDAIEKFERAIELEKAKRPPINVLALVNRALAVYQWKHDTIAAIELCEEAFKIDQECDAAIATLAQLYLQVSRLDDAIDMFERHKQLARTPTELEQIFTFEYATRAQKEFAKNYPVQAEDLMQRARSMGQPIPGF
ncbi:TOM (translocase of outer membrane) complex component [Tulasnella sp. 403]|nr:TOM (translocase of outer membrane) complex component [Tulasnella sp. 403]